MGACDENEKGIAINACIWQRGMLQSKKGRKFSGTWLRSGNNNNASYSNGLYSSGAYNNFTVSSVGGVRPALHSSAKNKRIFQNSASQRLLNRNDMSVKGLSSCRAQKRAVNLIRPYSDGETFRGMS